MSNHLPLHTPSSPNSSCHLPNHISKRKISLSKQSISIHRGNDVPSSQLTAAPAADSLAPTSTLATQIHHDPSTFYTRIHGQWFNLKPFVKLHPGGENALSLIAGRDGTILFESYHPFVAKSKLNAILNKYRVPEAHQARLRTLEQDSKNIPSTDGIFDWPEAGSEFGNHVKHAVHQYFMDRAKKLNISVRQATKGTRYRFTEQVSMGLMFIASIYQMVSTVSGFWLLACPIFGWLFAVNVFHDASHFAFSEIPVVNTVVSYLFPYFSSPSTWAMQHVIGHHAYPNLPHLDPDVNHSSNLRRDHPKMPWIVAHGQQYRMSRLIPHWIFATTFGLNLINEVESFFSHMYNEAVPIYPQSKANQVGHFLARFSTVAIMLFWPIYFHYSTLSFGWILLFALVPSFIFSSLFMLNTQINHLTPKQLTQSNRDWYMHQVMTAQNFGMQSKFHFYMSGGLNYQIEHHLFPGVNHCHLPALQPLVREICAKHGVPYSAASGYWEAVCTYWTHTNNMAIKPEESLVKSCS